MSRAEDAEKMMQEDPSGPAIGVDENTALVVVGNEAHVVSGDGNATCHAIAPREVTGHMKTFPFPTSDTPVPISQLFGHEHG